MVCLGFSGCSEIKAAKLLPQHKYWGLISGIKEKIIKRVKAELSLRIEKGYENIDLDAVKQEIDKSLKEAKIT